MDIQMAVVQDEGYTDEDTSMALDAAPFSFDMTSLDDCEELALKLLASLPRSRLASIQRRIAPLLQFDVVHSLPAEVSLQIFSQLSYHTLLTCSLVSKAWYALANDQAIWKILCERRGWSWKNPITTYPSDTKWRSNNENDDDDDEGMGEEENQDEDEVQQALTVDPERERVLSELEAAKQEITRMYLELDSGFASLSTSASSSSFFAGLSKGVKHNSNVPPRNQGRHSAPSVLPTVRTIAPYPPQPDYKRLYQTHLRLYRRIVTSSYKLHTLQTRNSPSDAHTNTIYCLQLYTHPRTGVQTLFTGSRDRTVREWDLTAGVVIRVIADLHESSVLSLCVKDGYVASAGSDRRVVVWDLERDTLVKILCDHDDSVLCVRFNDKQLVSCSKDRTVRTYSFPSLRQQFVLGAHRAAVNAVSLSHDLIVSGSGDRSIRLWCARTGNLLRTFENHHERGIASIDFNAPYLISGSSDRHLRFFDVTNLGGWGTAEELRVDDVVCAGGSRSRQRGSCAVCGHGAGLGAGAIAGNTDDPDVSVDAGVVGVEGDNVGCVHTDLVRSVALGEDFVVSGSYDLSIKVWNRKTGALVANLTDGHTGRIFCVGFDRTKIVSCGEDLKICVWDFSHGIDTSFMQF